MRAAEIAETLFNGNISHARHEIIAKRSAQEAAVLTLEVLEEMIEYASDGLDIARMIEQLHRCLAPHYQHDPPDDAHLEAAYEERMEADDY